MLLNPDGFLSGFFCCNQIRDLNLRDRFIAFESKGKINFLPRRRQYFLDYIHYCKEGMKFAKNP